MNMTDSILFSKENIIKGLRCCSTQIGCHGCPYEHMSGSKCSNRLKRDALTLLKEQEPRELTKEEWERWKKDERRDPICMIWYGDTTPFWVLRPESIHEHLYLMGKIKLFTKKPPKEQVKWDDK